MKFVKIALFAIVLARSGTTIYAQTEGKDTVPVNAIDLKEVVISVNKTQESKRYIAQEVQVINARDITQIQAQSTADLMSNTGTVYVQKSQMGGGSITLRGFEASRNLLVIDGVRMNNLIYRSGHLQNIVTTDNNALERVEILFGPASTVYGSDALGGVIHLFTRKAQLATGDKPLNIKVNTLSRYGSVNNELTNHFNLNIGGRKLASFTAITYSKFGDLRGGTNQNPFYTDQYGVRPYYVERINGRDSLIKNADRYLQVHSGFSQYDILQKILYKQSDNLSHGLNIHFSNSTDVPRYDRLTDPAGSGLRSAEWYYGPQTRLMVAYDFDYAKPDAFFQTIHAGLNYQNVEESRHDRRFGRDNLSHRTEQVGILGANIDAQRVIEQHNIRLGLDAQYNTLTSTAYSEDIVTKALTPLDTRYPDGDNHMANAAIYASHTWRITDNTTLVDGLRLGFVTLQSTFSDTSFFKFPFSKAEQINLVWSGNIGVIHHPSDDWKLSALLSTGFRAPNVDDLGKVFDSEPGTLIVPNADIKPERTISTELGITKVINKRSRWENTVYYTQFLDAIVINRFQYNGQDSIFYNGEKSAVFANQNQRQAYIYGFSSNLRTQLDAHFSLSLTMSYTYGRVKTDSSDANLDHIPPFMSRLGLSFLNGDFSGDFFINYNGWKRLKDYSLNGEDNEQYATPDGMPAWLTANIRTSYKLNKYVTLQAGVDNLFDTQYRTFASGINAPGRNIFGSLRFSLAS